MKKKNKEKMKHLEMSLDFFTRHYFERVERVIQLTAEIEAMNDENTLLHDRIKELEEENDHLKAENGYLYEYLGN